LRGFGEATFGCGEPTSPITWKDRTTAITMSTIENVVELHAGLSRV